MAQATYGGNPNAGCHLEVAVLVEGPPSEMGHEAQGGHVHVLTGEEEERHGAAMGHAVLGQRVVDAGLGLEQHLEKKIHEREMKTTVVWI